MLLDSTTFQNIELTSCQSNALRTLEPLITGSAQVGILKGYAGTGKTYLTSLIVKHLMEEDVKVKVITPTGRAAKVLEIEFRKNEVECTPTTIHSFIYEIEPIDYSKQQLSLFATVKGSDEHGSLFLIVDESSMVGNVKREQKEEGLNFGTGSLLDDLFDYLKLDENPNSKILFVGDPGQLAPIQGKEKTPALIREELTSMITQRSIPSKEVLECELKKVLRQEEGSLKEFVTEVRDSFINHTALPKKRREHVNPIFPENVIDLYLDKTSRMQYPERCILLAHKNSDVYKYNLEVRHALQFSDTPINQGETLLVRRNKKSTDFGDLDISKKEEHLSNGTFIQVVDTPVCIRKTEVLVRNNKVKLNFWKARIRHIGSDHEFDVTILQNMLDHTFWEDYQQQYKLIESSVLIDFQKRMLKKHGWSPAKQSDAHYKAYSREAEKDKFLNAIRVNYGYAVTVHNAQGGEWDTVIVDPKNPSRDFQGVQHHVSYSRWVYTASTRAKKELYFIKSVDTETNDTLLDEEDLATESKA